MVAAPAAARRFRRCARGILALCRRQRYGLARQRDLQDLVDPAYRPDVELALDVVRNLDQILLVLLRDHHDRDPAALRGEQLLLLPAAWHNLPPRRYLP